jgi:hypothetical protein
MSLSNTVVAGATEPTVALSRRRAELAALRARYDSGAVTPGIYGIIRQLEVDIAWAEHQEARS